MRRSKLIFSLIKLERLGFKKNCILDTLLQRDLQCKKYGSSCYNGHIKNYVSSRRFYLQYFTANITQWKHQSDVPLLQKHVTWKDINDIKNKHKITCYHTEFVSSFFKRENFRWATIIISELEIFTISLILFVAQL